MPPQQPPPFSWTILLTLLVIAGVSLATFMVLVRRWTTRRQWVALGDWARQRRFHYQPIQEATLPPPIAGLFKPGDERSKPVSSAPQARLCLAGERATVMQLETGPEQRWHVLLRRSPVRRTAAAGLRPTNLPASFLDRLNLSPYPSLTLGHRFTVLAGSSSAARTLADSASRTLLPPDVGLLVADEWILLDFSTRPFDPVELDRMLALAEQLNQML